MQWLCQAQIEVVKINLVFVKPSKEYDVLPGIMTPHTFVGHINPSLIM